MSLCTGLLPWPVLLLFRTLALHDTQVAADIATCNAHWPCCVSCTSARTPPVPLLFRPLSSCLFRIRVWYLSRYISTLIPTAALHGASLIFTTSLFFLSLSLHRHYHDGRYTGSYFYTTHQKHKNIFSRFSFALHLFSRYIPPSQVIHLTCSPSSSPLLPPPPYFPNPV